MFPLPGADCPACRGAGGDGGHGDGHAEAGHEAEHANADHASDSVHGDLPGNPLDAAAESAAHGSNEHIAEAGHHAEQAAGDLHAAAGNALPASSSHGAGSSHEAGDKTDGHFEVAADAGAHGAEPASGAHEAAQHAAEVIYTNPLPHVLILTAIVVGVATTAVGLALAVRIREAYGVIEEDDLTAADHLAEFGLAPDEAVSEGRA